MTTQAGSEQSSVKIIQNESWLEDFSNSLDIGTIVISKDFKVLYSNQAAQNFWRQTNPDFNGKISIKSALFELAKNGSFGDVDPKEHTISYLKSLRKMMNGGSTTSIPSQFHTVDGRTLNVKRTVTKSGDLLVTIEDISQRHKHEEILDMALSLGKSGYFIYSFETNKLVIQSDYLTSILTKAEARNVQDDGFWGLIHTDDVEDARQHWKVSIDNLTIFDRTLRIVTELHGLFWFKLHARTLVTNAGQPTSIICFFEDVTDDLALQDDLRKAKEQAEKTLQAQNNFLARLSHEIRTPMNAVIGITDALLQHGTDEKISAKLKLVQSSADSMMNILEGTLSHTKLDADKLMLENKLGNPIETVKTICDLWETQAKKNGTELSCHIDNKVPDEINFDKFRYEQCLNNLISNAVKFTPNGKVKLVLTVVDQDGVNPRLVVAVKDNGIGMTQEQQTRIFDAYTQADNSISSRFGGTGLGMNITKNIIELMGGKISVKSEIGVGTIFALSLPIDVNKPAQSDPNNQLIDHILEAPEAKETPYQKLKILVADDNPTNHMVVESLLETVVGQIYKANDGQEVLDVLDREEIDVVLMDIHMPIMDGIESTLAIRSSDKHWSDVLIIAVTADPQYQQLRLCKNIGMDDSLAKPIKLSGLLEAFDRVLQIDRKNVPYKDLYREAG